MTDLCGGSEEWKGEAAGLVIGQSSPEPMIRKKLTLRLGISRRREQASFLRARGGGFRVDQPTPPPRGGGSATLKRSLPEKFLADYFGRIESP